MKTVHRGSWKGPVGMITVRAGEWLSGWCVPITCPWDKCGEMLREVTQSAGEMSGVVVFACQAGHQSSLRWDLAFLVDRGAGRRRGSV